MTTIFTPEKITELKKNEVFVFGSNLKGNHAGGSAKLAQEKFGAVNGHPIGLLGQSYALPTLDEQMNKLPLNEISRHIENLYDFANENADLIFFVTKIGCGIAGFDEKEISDLFKSKDTPLNVILPMSFSLIKGFKGFNDDFSCRGYQFEEDRDFFHNGKVETCESGFHFCLNPFDVFRFYKGKDKIFSQVEGCGSVDFDNKDSKVSVSEIRIKTKLNLLDFIKIGIDFTNKKVEFYKKRAEKLINKNINSVNSGLDYSVNSGNNYSVNSGRYYSVNSGLDYSVNSGIDSSVNSGRDYSVNSGIDSSVNSGRDYSVNSGIDYSVNSGIDSSVNSGRDYSVNSGRDYSVNSGNNSSVNSGNNYSVNSGRDYSVNSGRYYSVNSGRDYSVNSGNNSSVNSGNNYSVNSGRDYSVNSGLDSSVNSGLDYSVNSGNNYSVCSGRFNSELSLNGVNSFGIAGKNSKIKGKKGCAICLVEYDFCNNIINVKSAIIDGEILKEDVFYELKNGEFYEV